MDANKMITSGCWGSRESFNKVIPRMCNWCGGPLSDDDERAAEKARADAKAKSVLPIIGSLDLAPTLPYCYFSTVFLSGTVSLGIVR